MMVACRPARLENDRLAPRPRGPLAGGDPLAAAHGAPPHGARLRASRTRPVNGCKRSWRRRAWAAAANAKN
ncbi:MAG: hypothetical protein ACLQLG_16585 [Thermoguttaceae bacterium]